MYNASPLTEKSVLEELGNRIQAHRIAQNISREDFAAQAGIGKNTLVRLEMGQSVSLSHFVKILLQFGFAESLIGLLPNYSQSPMMLLRNSQKSVQRKRAGRKKKESEGPLWNWGEDV